MKYVVVVIFKNQMKLDKEFNSAESAKNCAINLANSWESGGILHFNHTYFEAESVLCVTWQGVENKDDIRE